MQLEHSFTIPVSIDEAWRVLLDIERVAPCMPGATLDSVDGDTFTGTVKVRVGPVGLTYKGEASFVETDEVAHRAVIDARGKDTRGSGTASAKVATTLHAAGAETNVEVITDLNITGKPAQFGRGVIVEVGNKLIGQFADCLADKLAGGTGGTAAATAPAATAAAARPAAEPVAAPPLSANGSGSVASGNGSRATRAVPPPEAEPINLVASAGPAALKRLAPVVVVLILFVVWRRRRSGG